MTKSRPLPVLDPKPHPASEAFPMMSDDELLELAADIAQNGQIFPCMIDQTGEWLLDGRNRKRACAMANITPRYERLAPDIDPVAYIYSANITRRNMTKGQQAIALAMLYPEKGTGGRGRKTVKHAEAAGFSQRLLTDARTIIQYPDLGTAVRDGGLPFEVALRTAHERNVAAQAGVIYMRRLRDEAPDLAIEVDEERMTLALAAARLDERVAEVENQRAHMDTTLKHAAVFARAFTDDAVVQQLIGYLGDSGYVEHLMRDINVYDWVDDLIDAAETLTALLRRRERAPHA